MEHVFQTDKQTQCSIEGDPDWWHDYHPEHNILREASPETKMAIAICNRCEAMDECREFAFRYSDLGGVWGGLVPSVRTRIRNNMGITPIPFTSTWVAPTRTGIKYEE